MVVIILPYISVSKQYVVHFIPTQCYMSTISIKLGESQNLEAIKEGQNGKRE